MLHSWFLDPSIIDPGTPNVRNDEPPFIQDPGSWARRPEAVTGIDNLFLAGEWIKTDQNVTTMEGANEGGRYAANGVLQASGYSGPMVKIVELFQAPWWRRSRRPTGRATAPGFRTRSTSPTPAGLRVSVPSLTATPANPKTCRVERSPSR